MSVIGNVMTTFIDLCISKEDNDNSVIGHVWQCLLISDLQKLIILSGNVMPMFADIRFTETDNLKWKCNANVC